LSITQTVLVFVGIPALVIAVVFTLVYSTSARRTSKRYRPGRPFTFAPVWFLAAPERVIGEGAAAALPAGGHRTALPAGPLLAQAADAPQAVASAHGETGGASDSW
jgi:hypothetical protein